MTRDDAAPPTGLTRRSLAVRAAAFSAAGALGAPLLATLRAAGGAAASPVVSFHMDRPYVDPTGRAEPYIPPGGARGAATLEGLGEAAFRRAMMWT